jgi:hypothetical protein
MMLGHFVGSLIFHLHILCNHSKLAEKTPEESNREWLRFHNAHYDIDVSEQNLTTPYRSRNLRGANDGYITLEVVDNDEVRVAVSSNSK